MESGCSHGSCPVCGRLELLVDDAQATPICPRCQIPLEPVRPEPEIGEEPVVPGGAAPPAARLPAGVPAFGLGRVLALSLALWRGQSSRLLSLSALVFSPILLAGLVGWSGALDEHGEGYDWVELAYYWVAPLVVVAGVAPWVGRRRSTTRSAAEVEISIPGRGLVAAIAVAVTQLALLALAGLCAVAGDPVLVGGLALAGFLICGTWVAVPVAVNEGRGALDSMARSWDLMRGSRARVIALAALLLVASGTIHFGVGELAPLGSAWLLHPVAETVLASMYAVVVSTTYCELVRDAERGGPRPAP